MGAMTGLAFVYLALPVAMAVYLLCLPRRRPEALLVLSVAFCFIAYPPLALYMIAVVATDMASLAIMNRYDENPLIRKICLAFSAAKNLGCILLFGGVLHVGLPAPEMLFGLYVVTLSAMGCVLQVYRRQVSHTGGPVRFALYCLYFPRLAAGPLASYRELAPELQAPDTSPTEIAKGLGMFIQGAVKFRILGQTLYAFYDTLRFIPQRDASVLGVWVTVFVLILSVYYRFSGCVDMARGIGRMMGIALPENFRYPHRSVSITDFFRRFNCSLTHYVRGVLGPDFTDKAGFAATSLGFLITGAAAGLWFGLSAGRLAWGIFLGLFLIMERYLYPGLFKRVPAALCRVYALLVIFLSFALFDAPGLSAGAQTAGQMLGVGGLPFYSERLVYLLQSNRMLLIFGSFLAIGVHVRLFSFFRRHTPALLYGALMVVINLFLLMLLTAFSI